MPPTAGIVTTIAATTTISHAVLEAAEIHDVLSNELDQHDSSFSGGRRIHDREKARRAYRHPGDRRDASAAEHPPERLRLAAAGPPAQTRQARHRGVRGRRSAGKTGMSGCGGHRRNDTIPLHAGDRGLKVHESTSTELVGGPLTTDSRLHWGSRIGIRRRSPSSRLVVG